MAFDKFFSRTDKPGTPYKGIHALTFQLQFFNKVVRRAPFHPSFLDILK
jgi:hypothetical protein